MVKFKRILFTFILVVCAFYAGMKFEQFLYLDKCLDLGGGQNPGNYPICVVEVNEKQAEG